MAEQPYKRYSADYRGGDYEDKPWEWCIIDEEDGLLGNTIIFNLTKEEAKALAKKMNE